MKKQNIKISASGYLYVDGIKISKRRITPLYIPSNFGNEVYEYALKWANKNYKMV